jgi:hypothetical protein
MLYAIVSLVAWIVYWKNQASIVPIHPGRSSLGLAQFLIGFGDIGIRPMGLDSIILSTNRFVVGQCRLLAFAAT